MHQDAEILCTHILHKKKKNVAIILTPRIHMLIKYSISRGCRNMTITTRLIINNNGCIHLNLFQSTTTITAFISIFFASIHSKPCMAEQLETCCQWVLPKPHADFPYFRRSSNLVATLFHSVQTYTACCMAVPSIHT